MDALEASCSSRNIVADGPNEGRTGGESVHERHALRSEGGTLLNPRTISIGNVSAIIKLNSTLPRNVSSAIIQSSWIQRLKPFDQTNTPREEPAFVSNTKENPICTHFTKDFSSCSRRLNQSSHHTRSSSWPPHALQLQGVEHSLRETGGSMDVMEGYVKPVVNSRSMVNQSIQVNSSHTDPPITQVPSNNITNSSDAGSRTGNLFAQQQSSGKKGLVREGFVPCQINRENSTLKKLTNFLDNRSGGDYKPNECLAQQEQNAVEDVKKLKSAGECNASLQMKGLLQTEETDKSMDCSYGSNGVSQGDILAPALPITASRAAHNNGASADADDKFRFPKSVNCDTGNKMLLVQASCVKPDSEIAFSKAVALENRVNVDKACEDGRFGREGAQTGSNFKQFKESVAKPYLLRNLSNIGSSSNFQLSQRNGHLSEAFDKTTGREATTTCVMGSRRVASLSSLKKDVFNRSDVLRTRETNLAGLQKLDFSEVGQASRLTLPVRSLHEDAARSRIREKSLGEYWNSWVRLLEEPYNVKPAEAGSPLARLQQDCTVGEYHETVLPLPSSRTGLDARQKLETYWSCSPHKHRNKDAENCGSCGLSQQMLALSSKKTDKVLDSRASSSQTNTGWGQGCHASADQTSNVELKCLQEPQKHDLCFYRGATGRVDSQLHNEDYGVHRKFLGDGSSHSRIQSAHPAQDCCNKERTGKASSMHHMWIQRWQSSAKFSAEAGKATGNLPYSARTTSPNQRRKSCSSNGQCLVISSQSATSGPPLKERNFAAFRSGYMASCVQATTIVRDSSSKLSPTSSQN